MSLGTATFNANANVQLLHDVLAVDSNLKAAAWARYLEVSSRQHDAFSAFESEQPRIPSLNAGKAGIFTRKRDLKAGGGDTVYFSVVSAPAGPGALGEQELTGRTSSSKFKTYKVIVDWHRDAVEFTRKQIEMMAGGQDLEPTAAELLKLKMGMNKQHEMMLSLIANGSGNTYRPNGRASRDAILATDTLSIDICSAAKARLNTMGGRPINHQLGENGDHINGFMIFATEMGMLSVRNDSGYQSAITQGHERGKGNANFTGKLVDWQGMSWFEHIVTDLDWDDYVGSPLQPKAICGVAIGAATALDSGALWLKASSTNTLSRYFQFFGGYDYLFTEDQTPVSDNTVYYAWAANPDGTWCFFSYVGHHNNGNKIDIASGNILASAAETSTKGATTVGTLYVGTGASTNESTRVIKLGTSTTLPATHTYVDRIDVGAVILPANSSGVLIGKGFVFGANAACRAYGRIEMESIRQERDYGFVKGMGYQMITGQAPCTNTNGVTNGYLNLEFAIEHEGYDAPSWVTAH